MNSQEFLNALKIIGGIVFALAAQYGIMTKDQATALLTNLEIVVPALLSFGAVVWSIYSHWNMKKVPENSVAIDAAHMVKDFPALPVPGHNVILQGDPSTQSPGAVVVKVVGALLFAIVLSSLALVGHANAQTKPPAPRVAPSFNINPVAADLAAVLQKFKAAPAPTTPDEIQSTTCDFTLFSKLTLANAVPLLSKCAQAVDAGAIAPLVIDVTNALASAKAFNSNAGDGTAVSCLTPALALLKAAEGIAPIKDANGVVTTPGTAPGVFTIGQKLREFVELGGPTNCKTTIQSTLNGLLAAGL